MVEKAKCLSFDAGLPRRFWAEAIKTSKFLRNQCIARSLDGKTLIEMWYKKKTDVSSSRIFDSQGTCYQREKVEIVGYAEKIKGT